MSVMVQVTILVLLMVSATMGATTCPPPEDAGPSMDEILYYSDVVVLGEVLEHYKDPQDPAAYTAEMEVYCVYKGHHVPSLINITKAGELLESETVTCLPDGSVVVMIECLWFLSLFEAFSCVCVCVCVCV